jgi:hypothetical protein
MSIVTLTEAERITGARLYMAMLSPTFSERFEAAETLLTRGYTRDGDTVRFRDGTVAAEEACSCQEGSGPVMCLHKLGARMLQIADRSVREVA